MHSTHMIPATFQEFHNNIRRFAEHRRVLKSHTRAHKKEVQEDIARRAALKEMKKEGGLLPDIDDENSIS